MMYSAFSPKAASLRASHFDLAHRSTWPLTILSFCDTQTLNLPAEAENRRLNDDLAEMKSQRAGTSAVLCIPVALWTVPLATRKP